VNRELAAELAAMVAEDQRLRQEYGAGSPSFERMMELTRVDVRNTERLRELVAEHGWPGRSLVGEQGANDAWLLAQHATHELSFQRHVVDERRAAAGLGPMHACAERWKNMSRTDTTGV
jgi:hypothetical protein